MRTFFVYINKVVRRNEYQWRVAATQNFQNIAGAPRNQIPAIWKVEGCEGSEHAKGRALMYQTFPGAPANMDGVVRIR